jgi:hypothetical protein
MLSLVALGNKAIKPLLAAARICSHHAVRTIPERSIGTTPPFAPVCKPSFRSSGSLHEDRQLFFRTLPLSAGLLSPRKKPSKKVDSYTSASSFQGF